jgi:hypothetical protein
MLKPMATRPCDDHWPSVGFHAEHENCDVSMVLQGQTRRRNHRQQSSATADAAHTEGARVVVHCREWLRDGECSGSKQT